MVGCSLTAFLACVMPYIAHNPVNKIYVPSPLGTTPAVSKQASLTLSTTLSGASLANVQPLQQGKLDDSMDNEDQTQSSLQLAEAAVHTLVQPKAVAIIHAPNPIAIANAAQNLAGLEDGAVDPTLAPQGAGPEADAEGESTRYGIS